MKYKAIINNQGTVFLRRWSFKFKNGSLKLHLITGNDSPVYHTHPWDFTSFMLFGGYREYTLIDRTKIQEFIETPEEIHVKNRRLFSINKKDHRDQHRVELFNLFGITIPALTIGWYGNKVQLCSFCKELGYCKSNQPKHITT